MTIGDRVSYQQFGKEYTSVIANIDQTHVYLEIPDNPENFTLRAHGRYSKLSLSKILGNDYNSLGHPIKQRREKGEGSGSIVKRFLNKKIKKEVKSYPQYWYDYELWENGQCLKKGSAYIPKNKLEEIESMNRDKKPVKAILEALGKTV